MSVKIRFERYSYEGGIRDLAAKTTLGPFDWVEVEGNQMIAESDGGNTRHDPLAYLEPEHGNWHWHLVGSEDEWHYFVVAAA
jgi:hypothetical protein